MFCIFFLLAAGCPVLAQAGSSLNDPTAPPSGGRSEASDAQKSRRQPLTLQSTIVSPQRRLAVINSRIYLEGDKLDGARLVRILPGEVILVRGQDSIRLSLFGRSVKSERKQAIEE